jgi:hypothetical protein
MAALPRPIRSLASGGPLTTPAIVSLSSSHLHQWPAQALPVIAEFDLPVGYCFAPVLTIASAGIRVVFAGLGQRFPALPDDHRQHDQCGDWGGPPPAEQCVRSDTDEQRQ